MEQNFLRMLLEGGGPEQQPELEVRFTDADDDSTSSETCFKQLKKAFKTRELSARGRLEYFAQAVETVQVSSPRWEGTQTRIEELETLLRASRQICQAQTFAEIQTVLAETFNTEWLYSTMASRSLSSKALRQIARSKLFELAVARQQ